MSEWISVENYKQVPEGNWIVRIENSKRCCDMEIMNSNKNISIIGGAFAFDHGRVTAYHPLPPIAAKE